MNIQRQEQEYRVGKIILIPEGTELNFGVHEDSDGITLTTDVRAIILEPKKNGAILVQLLDNNGEKIGDLLYFHQPAY